MGEVSMGLYELGKELICRPFRLLGFGGCLIGAAVCFFVAFLTLPLLALRPAKFALSFR
jgi:hypothetical protein